MDARLVVAKGKTSVKEIPLGTVNTVIGRRTDCGLRIPSPLVSRQHCELKCAGNRLIVRDLGSSNGTFVNGSKIKQKELKSGDTLGVGPITFIVQLGGRSVSPSDTARPDLPAAGDDAGDFVVAEEVESTDAADFVVGEEADVSAADEGDFVVAAEADDEASEFVVADVTDDTAIGETSDFVVADEPEAESEFVVADEVSADDDTVQQPSADERPAKGRAKKGAKAKPAASEPAEAAAEPEQPQPKVGFFGRLFKKKEKKSDKTETAASEKKAKESKPAKESTPAAAAAPAEPVVAAESEAVEEFITEDEPSHAGAKPVGEDELADFLMGLNEKDQ